MLNVHDSFVILPLLFCFLILEDGSCALVTLALRINMSDPDVKEGILTMTPEVPCSHVQARTLGRVRSPGLEDFPLQIRQVGF